MSSLFRKSRLLTWSSRGLLFVRTHFSILFVLFLWFVANITLFIVQFRYYHGSSEFFYLRVLVSDGLSVSRGAALCLNFNSALILLPVCRNALSLLRCLFPKCLLNTGVRRWFIRLADHHIEFHRFIGYAICFWVVVHVAGHIRNFERLLSTHGDKNSLVSVLNNLFLHISPIQANPFNRLDSNVLQVQAMFNSIPGWTGLLLVLILMVILTSSTYLIRRSFYGLFWSLHHLFLLYFVFFSIHGIQGVIRRQTNLHEHDPYVCSERFHHWGIERQCLKYPKFKGLPPSSWKWIIGPLVLYLTERIIRFLRSLQKVEIIDVIKHPSDVIEIRFEKKAMQTPQPGQYVNLKFFSVAKFEWHPFTVTSAPDDSYISVHIRIVGDWTRELAERLKDFPNNVPRLSVDGPYGSPSDDVFNYDSIILIGAGIGVTPYTSILKHMQLSRSKKNRVNKIYFYWICNTTVCYEWFADMLCEVERDLRARNISLTLKMCLTKWSPNQLPSIIDNVAEDRDIYTGLKAKTFYGRPNFYTDFRAIVCEHVEMSLEQSIGVFVCGPKVMSDELRRVCVRINDHTITKGRVRFYLNKENF